MKVIYVESKEHHEMAKKMYLGDVTYRTILGWVVMVLVWSPFWMVGGVDYGSYIAWIGVLIVSLALLS